MRRFTTKGRRVLRWIMAFAAALPFVAGAAQPGFAADKVVIGLWTDVNTLDPVMTNTVGTDLSVISHLYTPMIIRGPDLKLKPALAKSWKAVDDHTWSFVLQSGITFPNGEPLDAAAVKWNIERILDPKVKARIATWFKPIKEVRVKSPTELEVVTDKPYPILPGQFSVLFLLPPKWTETHNPAQQAMGTGPYDLVESVSGDHITLKAKAKYWGEKPPFDTVVFRPIPEDASRIAAVLSGDIDVVVGFPPSEIERLNKSGKVKAGGVPSTRSMSIKLNGLKPPFQDNLVLRQALNYAVDKQAIIKAIFGGMVPESRCQVLMDGYFGYNPDLKPYPYDPAKAKAMLAKAGYPSGLSVELEVPQGRYMLASEINQAIAAMLENVGVRVKLVEMQFGPFMDKYLKAHDMAQMAYLGMGWPTLDADGLLTLWDPASNYSYWPDKEFGDLLAQGRSTTDEATRLQIYAKATARMCEQAPNIFLFNQPITYAHSLKIDWQARPDDWVRAFEMKPAK